MNRTALAVASAVIGLALPATASASATCSWDLYTHVLTVTFAGDGGHGTLTMEGNGNIELNGGSCSQTASYTTVGTVKVQDLSGKPVQFTIDERDGDFAPGVPIEAASSEIEFDVDLGSGPGDELEVVMASKKEGLAVGTGGVNLNALADAAGGMDSDVTTTGVDKLRVEGGFDGAPVTIDGRGGQGTGAPTSLPMDVFTGTAVTNRLYGGTGDDVFEPGDGDDLMDGGDGEDTLQLRGYGANIDLSQTVPQPTAGHGNDSVLAIEDVIGTDYNDDIVGNDEPNVIDARAGEHDSVDGGGGDDVITGGAGVDVIDAGTGADVVYAQDGVADEIACGNGFDTVVKDAIDVITGCPTAPTPSVTPTPSTTPTGDPTPPAGGVTPPPDGTSPTTPGGGTTPTDGGGQGRPPGGDAAPPKGGDTPQGVPDAGALRIVVPRQKRAAVRKRGLRVRLVARESASVAIHAGRTKDVYWAVDPKRATTLRLRLSRRILHHHRTVIVARVQDRTGNAYTVHRTVRLPRR